jgi:hypothetical protein
MNYVLYPDIELLCVFLRLLSPVNAEKNPASSFPESFLCTTWRRNMKLTLEMPAVILQGEAVRCHHCSFSWVNNVRKLRRNL